MSPKLFHLGWLVCLVACSSSGQSADADAGMGATGGSGAVDAASSDSRADGPFGTPDTSVVTDGPSCQWPASADTFSDASGSGCTPRAAFMICEVPNGGTIEADGAILAPDGALVTDSCANSCSATEYALNCRGAGGAPDPDPSLGCNVIPIPGNLPTSMNYCCRCPPG